MTTSWAGSTRFSVLRKSDAGAGVGEDFAVEGDIARDSRGQIAIGKKSFVEAQRGDVAGGEQAGEIGEHAVRAYLLVTIERAGALEQKRHRHAGLFIFRQRQRAVDRQPAGIEANQLFAPPAALDFVGIAAGFF